MKNILKHRLSDMSVKYIISENDIVGLEIVPISKEKDVVNKDCLIESIVQGRFTGDDFPAGFSNGNTMRNSASFNDLKFKNQKVEKEGSSTVIITELESKDGRNVKHYLEYKNGDKALRVKTIFTNNTDTLLTLEMLSSFSISGLTPFEQGEATETLKVHRLRSKWSNEGRLESQAVEDLQLEPTWLRYGVASEKFGQLGSLPVRRFFPFIAVEDVKNNITWGAQLACPSSWQIEVYRKDEGLSISGGLPDYDYGHWRKDIAPGECFETPEAFFTVAEGGVNVASQRLTRLQEPKKSITSEPNRLPVIFNEFCTTWGVPNHQNIKDICKVIKDKQIDYFIIDAGWYSTPGKNWANSMGDWEISDTMFPNGLADTVEIIREAGLKPGIWFELECCAEGADSYHNIKHLLKRDGKVITVGSRRFWDMRDPWTISYLSEKVIDFLNKYGFEYLKVDYNESIGVGCDGAESLGEGLRQQMLASQEFLKKIRNEVPNIAIEICASGGHRLEPSMMALGDMASFSDAHEEKEIPIIAANVHRAIMPKQSQIWAVIRKKDDERRIAYSLISAFLGVMCLSGDVFDLNEQQWYLIDKGIDFYRSISHIIQNGYSEFYGPYIKSYRKLRGWQAVVRYNKSWDEAYAVVHRFEMSGSGELLIPIKKGFVIKEVFGASDYTAAIKDGMLMVKLSSDFEAIALYLVIE